MISNRQEEIDRLKNDINILTQHLQRTDQAKSSAEGQAEQLRSQVTELQQQVTNLQQNSSRRNASVSQSGAASELIRARALEAAREEIKELREANEEVKQELDRVISGRKDSETELKEEIERLGA